MAKRGALYRCHLFSFGGPQTEGVAARWTKNLKPIGDREVLSGELVELRVTIDGALLANGLESTPAEPSGYPRLRFDILEEDYILSGGSDDFVLSILGPGATAPGEGIPAARRLLEVVEMAEPGDFRGAVQQFKRDHPADFSDFILAAIREDEPSPTCEVVTWWQAEHVADVVGDAEFYFIVNVNDDFDDQTEATIEVSEARVPPGRDQFSSYFLAVDHGAPDTSPASDTNSATLGDEADEVGEETDGPVARRMAREPLVAGVPTLPDQTPAPEPGLPEDVEPAESSAEKKLTWPWEERPDGPVADDRVETGAGPLHRRLVAIIPGTRYANVDSSRFIVAYDFQRAIRWGFLVFGRHSFIVVEAAPTTNRRPAYYVLRIDESLRRADVAIAKPYLTYRRKSVYDTRIRYLENIFTDDRGRIYLYRALFTTDDMFIFPGGYYRDPKGRVRANNFILREYDRQTRNRADPEAVVPASVAIPILFGDIDRLIGLGRIEAAAEALAGLDANAFSLFADPDETDKRPDYIRVLLQAWTFRAQEQAAIEIMKSITRRDELEAVVRELDDAGRFDDLLELDKLWSLLVTIGRNFGSTLQLDPIHTLRDIFVTEVFTTRVGLGPGVALSVLEIQMDPDTGEVVIDPTIFRELETAARGFLRALEGTWDAIKMIFTQPDDVLRAIGQLMKLWYNVQLARPPFNDPEAQAYVNTVWNSMATAIKNGFKGMLILNEIAGRNRVTSRIQSRLKWAVLWEALSWFIGVGEISAALKLVGSVSKLTALARLARILRGPIRLAKFERVALLLSRARGLEHSDFLRYISLLPEDDIRRLDRALEAVPSGDILGPRRAQSLDELVGRHPGMSTALEDIRPRLDMVANLEKRFRSYIGDSTAELSDNAIEGFNFIATHPQAGESANRVLRHVSIQDGRSVAADLSATHMASLLDSVPAGEIENFMRTILSLDDVRMLDAISFDQLVELASRPAVMSFILDQGADMRLFTDLMSASGGEFRLVERNIEALQSLRNHVGRHGGPEAVDGLMDGLRAGDGDAWRQLVDARQVDDAIPHILDATQAARAHIADAAREFLQASGHQAATAARQRILNLGLPAGIADNIIGRLEMFRLVRRLDLDQHVTGWTRAHQAVIDSIDADGWAAIASHMRSMAADYRTAVNAGNEAAAATRMRTAKGVLAEEVFITSREFGQVMADARRLAAREGVSPERVGFFRNATTRAVQNGTPTGGRMQYTDGLIGYVIPGVDGAPDKFRILGFLESKSRSNVGDLVPPAALFDDLVPPADFPGWGQLQNAFARIASDGESLIVGGRTFPAEHVSIRQTNTLYVAIQPDTALRAGGRAAGGTLGPTRIERAAGVGNVPDTIPNFRLFTNSLPDEVIEDVTKRILQLL